MATYKTHYKLYDGSTWNEYYFYTSAAVVSDTTTRKWVPWSANMSADQILMSQSDTNGTLGPQWVSPTNLLVGGASQLVDSSNNSNSYTYSSLKSALDSKQPLSTSLSNIDALTGTGFLKKTAASTWSLDTTSYATETALSTHTGDTNNPHSVTKAQVGLEHVVDAGQTTEFTSADASNGTQYFTRQGAVNLYGSLIAVANGKKTTYVISSASISDTTLRNKICKSITSNVSADFVTLTLAEIKSAGILGSSATEVSSLSIGDVVLIKEVDYHDLWISAVDILNKQIKLSPLETQKYDLTGFSTKSETVSDVAWDGTNKKITRTINGSAAEVVSAATLKTAMSLGTAADKNYATSVADGETGLVTGDAVYDYVNAAISNEHKTYLMNIEDQTNALITKFETQTDFSIDIDFTASTDSSTVFNLATSGTLNMAKLHSGDIIYLTELNFPDRWIEVGATKIIFHILETYTPKITASQTEPSIKRSGDVWLQTNGTV